jgi:HEPN domain-containing protein
MSGHDPDVLEKVRQWVRYADEDLAYAQLGLSMEAGCPFRLVAYHAQQCAEKYLKGYLVLTGTDFPYTHDIERLLSLCSAAGASVTGLMDAAELTSYAITTRYPGEVEEVDRAEAERAVQLAVLVKRTVEGWLTEGGL